MEFIFFTLMGFCLGSTLFAYWIPKLLKGIDIRELPEDHNPGVANAYLYGNFWLGTLALFCELGKGFFPVFLSQRFVTVTSLLFVPVMAAPVFGHACPFFHREKGGKAIAVSFGVMLGLYPVVQPLFYLVLFYLLFSLVLIIRPHSRRTIVTFTLFSCAVFLRVPFPSIKLGCFIISAIVVSKHVVSRSTSKAPHVRPL
ncbi:MAG: glycerol-3-phosphate acyltransferase [Roseburia sp.]|nr:glycerol-3-phosphate acyltransferase [Roseburia sp.]